MISDGLFTADFQNLNITMDIKAIKDIVNNEMFLENVKEHLIIKTLSQDPNVYHLLMKLIDEERKAKRELMVDMNLYLSKAHVALRNPKINKDHFIDDEIDEFYVKHVNEIGHCFMNNKAFADLVEEIKSKKQTNEGNQKAGSSSTSKI
jgi:hypothetical protein